MQRIRIEEFIQGITDEEIREYSEYMKRLRPSNDDSIFDRFLFAFCSIQTGWETNVTLYTHLQDRLWVGDEATLMDILVASRAGLQNNRARYLHAFGQDWIRRQGAWNYRPEMDESWVHCRDRVVCSLLGMGIAKVSFVMEMVFPLRSEVVCLDRHMLRMYKHKTESITPARYREYEAHWVKQCKKRNIPPAVARWILWDKIQHQSDSRYWAYILEPRRRATVA